MLEERIVEHFRECESAMENIHVVLDSAQMKLKGNMILQRQVKNMERHNWSLWKMLRISRLQLRP
jgi:hypothetical protein